MGVVREIWGVGFGIMNPKFERRFLLAVQQRFLPPTSAKNAFSYAASRYPPLAVEPLGLESYMCDGDSGSPLVAELMDGRRVALGVASSVYMDPAHAADKSRSCTVCAVFATPCALRLHDVCLYHPNRKVRWHIMSTLRFT